MTWTKEKRTKADWFFWMRCMKTSQEPYICNVHTRNGVLMFSDIPGNTMRLEDIYNGCTGVE